MTGNCSICFRWYEWGLMFFAFLPNANHLNRCDTHVARPDEIWTVYRHFKALLFWPNETISKKFHFILDVCFDSLFYHLFKRQSALHILYTIGLYRMLKSWNVIGLRTFTMESMKKKCIRSQMYNSKCESMLNKWCQLYAILLEAQFI